MIRGDKHFTSLGSRNAGVDSARTGDRGHRDRQAPRRAARRCGVHAIFPSYMIQHFCGLSVPEARNRRTPYRSAGLCGSSFVVSSAVRNWLRSRKNRAGSHRRRVAIPVGFVSQTPLASFRTAAGPPVGFVSHQALRRPANPSLTIAPIDPRQLPAQTHAVPPCLKTAVRTGNPL
jgi:hypothetical protein